MTGIIPGKLLKDASIQAQKINLDGHIATQNGEVANLQTVNQRIVAEKLQIEAGSAPFLEIVGNSLRIKSLAVSAVVVDTTSADLAAALAANYTNGDELQAGDFLIIQNATGGTLTYQHIGTANGDASDFILAEKPDLDDAYIRSLLSGVDGVNYNPATGEFSLRDLTQPTENEFYISDGLGKFKRYEGLSISQTPAGARNLSDPIGTRVFTRGASFDIHNDILYIIEEISGNRGVSAYSMLDNSLLNRVEGFSAPRFVKVNPNSGSVYVSDTSPARVKVFTNTLSAIPAEEFASGLINTVSSMSIANDKFYLQDSSQDRLFVFDLNNPGTRIPSEERTNTAVPCVHVDASTNKLYLVEGVSIDEIQVFDLNTGNQLTSETISIGNIVIGSLQTYNGKLYASNQSDNSVTVYDLNTRNEITSEKKTDITDIFDVVIYDDKLYVADIFRTSPSVDARINIYDLIGANILNISDQFKYVPNTTIEENPDSIASIATVDARIEQATTVLQKGIQQVSPNDTTGDGAATGITFPSKPKGGLFFAIVGASFFEIGDAVKTDTFYVSRDGGATALAWTDIEAGDELYFNGTIAGFNLANATDKISIKYSA